MIFRRVLLALGLILGLAGFAVQAAAPNSLRVQVIDEHGMPVRDAVVELTPSRGANYAFRFPWRMAMAQRNEQFVPGTLVVAKGSTVAFPNLDKVRHSVYSFSKPARFEINLYGRDQTRTHKFLVAGSVKLGCNIHDDMRGYIRVTDTPFAGKTDHNGYISLDALPTGSASLTVWHPRLRAPGNEVTQPLAINKSLNAHAVKVRLR